MAPAPSESVALDSRVRAWLRPELQDADESRRTWRLRCIQAEAERRKLFSQNPGASGGALPSGAPPQAETQAKLAKAIALERQIEELGTLLATLEEDVGPVRTRAAAMNERIADRRAATEQAASLAVASRSELLAQETANSLARDEHRKKCDILMEEARTAFAECEPSASVEEELGNALTAESEVTQILQILEQDIALVLRDRERLWMTREEVRNKHCDLTDSHAQATREAAAAKHAAQVRNTAMSRLQGEVLRTRSRSERKRRVLEGHLMQCRSELAEAAGRADAAGERLRKLKQQQGKQLRDLRSETSGLQSEVEEHLLAIETSEASLLAVRNEEAELETWRLEQISGERALDERAAACQAELSMLEHEVAAREAYGNLGLQRLRKCEEELSQEECFIESCWVEAASLRAQAEHAEIASQQVRDELSEERELSGDQGDDLEKLEALETKVKGMKAQNAELVAEHLQLQESAKQSQKSYDKSLADLQEAIRRTKTLKGQHDQLVEPVASSRNREALINVMEQALSRVNKKAEAVITCLESGPGGSSSKAARGSDANSASALVQRSQAALQRRLNDEHERSMESLLAEERKKVVAEQQRSLTEARRRTSELQKARQERRRLQENLARCQQSYDWIRRSSESELLGLEAQVKLVDREATEGAEAVTAEFSDLLQKQALERDVLQAQVDELRAQVNGACDRSRDDAISETIDENDDASMSPSYQALPSTVVMQRLVEEEVEIEGLRAEEEDLQQAHVKLKAAVVASQQRLREGTAKLSLSPISPRSRMVLASHENASASASSEPRTPSKQVREALTSPIPTIVCANGVQDGVDAGSDAAIASPSYPASGLSPSQALQLEHQRSISHRTVSSNASVASLPVVHRGQPMLTRSESSHSVGTSEATPNLSTLQSAGAPVARVLARRPGDAAVCTWPSRHTPSQQDTSKDAVDPRVTATLG